MRTPVQRTPLSCITNNGPSGLLLTPPPSNIYPDAPVDQPPHSTIHSHHSGSSMICNLADTDHRSGNKATNSNKATKTAHQGSHLRPTTRNSKYSVSPKSVISIDASSPTTSMLHHTGIHPCFTAATLQSKHMSVIDRPRGRPPGNKPNTTPLLPLNLNQALDNASDNTHNSEFTNQDDVRNTKKKPNIGRPRGKPPNYKFNQDELIPLNINLALPNDSSNSHELNPKLHGISPNYIDIGDSVYVCTACKAKLWKKEAMRGNRNFTKKAYSLCCGSGKVELPGLKFPPRLLLDLFLGRSPDSKTFLENVRKYNMMFAFTSMGGKVDHKINNGHGPYVYRMCGQNYHLAGSLIPEDGEQPMFSQLYIYDTQSEDENRINAYE